MNKLKIEYLLQTKLISRKKFGKKMGVPYSAIFQEHDEEDEKFLCTKASSILNVSENYLNNDVDLNIINKIGNWIILCFALIFTFIPFIPHVPVIVNLFAHAFRYPDYALLISSCSSIILTIVIFIIYRRFILRFLLIIPFIINSFFIGFWVLAVSIL